MTTFSDLGLDPSLLKSLERMGYTEPTPVQAEAIPIIKQNKDLIALAQTGSGKTAACAIPICDKVDTSNTRIQSLIIVPTRELALQYATEMQKIGRDKEVKAFAIFGGEDAGTQLSKIKHGVQVLVATPGRLIDFIYRREIDLSTVNTLVLDEADEMLSLGFHDDLLFIMQCLVQEHQTLLFSATMPKEIKTIAVTFMKDPVEVTLTSQASPSTIDHLFVYCRHHHKEEMIQQLIKEKKPTQSIVFCHSRIEVEKVCRSLQKNIDGVDYLHAGLNQDVRTIITNKFRSGRIRTLVATDVAARGLDFSGVSHVFIYHLADDPEIYVHRSGRTGRAKRDGVVITLVTDRELHSLQKVLTMLKQPATWLGDPPPENARPARRPAPANRRRRPPTGR